MKELFPFFRPALSCIGLVEDGPRPSPRRLTSRSAHGVIAAGASGFFQADGVSLVGPSEETLRPVLEVQRSR